MSNLETVSLSDRQLRKLQLELLTILNEFDRICNKYEIPYFLQSGTLLGAVRHKGFIPWDDDIDVTMLRSDYEKFQEIIEDELDKEKFFFQSQETDIHYNWVFGRLRLNNTVFSRAGQEHLDCHDGFFIDIFPLDNLSENKIKQFITKNMCKLCKKILYSPVGKIHGKNMIHKFTFRILNMIPRNIAVLIYEYFAIKFNKIDSPLLVSHNADGCIFLRNWFDNSIKLEFEGNMYPSPENYDEILKKIYGNYTKLPPLENRKAHHTVSYIKYSDGEEVSRG